LAYVRLDQRLRLLHLQLQPHRPGPQPPSTLAQFVGRETQSPLLNIERDD
jgi:hypothetical protein